MSTIPTSNITARSLWALLLQYQADLLSIVADKGASLVALADAGAYFATDTVEAALQAIGKALLTHALTDPGNAGAIAVTKSGSLALTSAGAETRTLAIPTFKGQQIAIYDDTHVGNIVITASQALNQAGNTVMTFGAVRDNCVLEAITVGGALRWQIIANDGVALS